MDLKKLLVEAFKLTKPKGSSTFVMAALDPDVKGLLRTINLGDSGYLIVRQSQDPSDVKLVYRSPEQLYGFDFPFQCGTNCDLPDKDSDCRVHIVNDGDIVVLASDGIFDNLFEEDILNCLRRDRTKSSFTSDSADCLANTAQRKSEDRIYESPFAKHAQAHGKSEPGGKVDDITVIVSLVKFDS